MRIAAWVRPFRSWFQSSSSPKTGCKVLGVLIPRVVVPVSILIQPEDRMQESGLGGFGQSQLCFNPHPARRPDASPVDMQQLRSGQPRFNPHPARRPDASGVPGRSPIDWAFQSSSSPKTGCKGGFVVIGEPHLNQFQSSSSPKTGCKRRGAGTAGGCRTCFNPHPARRPDASGAGREQPAVAVLVSILIQPEDRMQACPDCLYERSDLRVSILIQPEDRMQGGVRVSWIMQGYALVSILIQPEDRMQACRIASVPVWRS